MSDKKESIILSKDEIVSIIREELAIKNQPQTKLLSKTRLTEAVDVEDCSQTASGKGFVDGGGANWGVSQTAYGPRPNRQGRMNVRDAHLEHLTRGGGKFYNDQGIRAGDVLDNADDPNHANFMASLQNREAGIEAAIGVLSRRQGLSPNSVTSSVEGTRLKGFFNEALYLSALEYVESVWGQFDDDILQSQLNITGQQLMQYLVDPAGAGLGGPANNATGWAMRTTPISGLCWAIVENCLPATNEVKLVNAYQLQMERWNSCNYNGVRFPSWFQELMMQKGADVQTIEEVEGAADAPSVRRAVMQTVQVIAFEGPEGDYMYLPLSVMDPLLSEITAAPSVSWAATQRHRDFISRYISGDESDQEVALYSHFRNLILRDSTPDLLCIRGFNGWIYTRHQDYARGVATRSWETWQWIAFVGTMFLGVPLFNQARRMTGYATSRPIRGTAGVVNIGGRKISVRTIDNRGMTATAGDVVELNVGDVVILAGQDTASAAAVTSRALQRGLNQGEQAAAMLRNARRSKLEAAGVDPDDVDDLYDLLVRRDINGETLSAAEAARVRTIMSSDETVAKFVKHHGVEAARINDPIAVAYARWQGAKGSAQGSASWQVFRNDVKAEIRSLWPWQFNTTSLSRAGLRMTRTIVGASAVGSVLSGGNWNWMWDQLLAWCGKQAIEENMPEDFVASLPYVSNEMAANIFERKAAGVSNTNRKQILLNISNVMKRVNSKTLGELGDESASDLSRSELLDILQQSLTFGSNVAQGQVPTRYRLTQDEMQLLSSIETEGVEISGTAAANALQSDGAYRAATDADKLNAICLGLIGEEYVTTLAAPYQNWFTLYKDKLGSSPLQRAERQENLTTYLRERIEALAAQGESNPTITIYGSEYNSETIGNLPIWSQGGNDPESQYAEMSNNRIVQNTRISFSDAKFNFRAAWIQQDFPSQ